MLSPFSLSSGLVRHLIFASVILFPGTVLDQFFVGDLNCDILRNLAGHIFPLTTTSGKPRISTIIVTGAEFRGTRAHRTRTITKHARNVNVNNGGTGATLRVPTLMVQDQPVTPPFSHHNRIEVNPSRRKRNFHFQ